MLILKDAQASFCYDGCMTKKQIFIAVSLSFIIVAILELLMSIPSHPECGTAGIDFMPCAYWARAVWYLQMGSWMPLVGLWVILAVGSLIIMSSKLKSE